MRKEWLETDYYAILGVDSNASSKDIKQAYRKLAQKYHPDTNKGDPVAENRFKEVNEAYEVIGDPETRKEYDHARQMGYFVGGPGGAQQYVRVEDLMGGGRGSPFDLLGGLGDLFGRQGVVRARDGDDLSAEMHLSFHDAISGTTRQITVSGQTVKVKIPKGVADGARIRVRGKGGPGRNGGAAGDLYVTVHVAEHPVFGRRGKHLTLSVPITFVEAALGAEIDVPTLDGKVRLKIPAGTQSGKTLRVRGHGVEDAKGTRGDLLVTVTVSVPEKLTEEGKELLQRFRLQNPDANPRSHLGV
ncbi:MAG: DnaJ C-terminal domain-containing protein [Acidimicrobiia bacterium]|nr:DnaJ C-terminal domain-containing protein [Acidimicrobiia bacterium]